MLVPKPKLVEQKEIARITDLLDSKVRLQRKKYDSLTDLFRTLLHQLMTAQIRVHEIDFPAFDAPESPP